MGVNKREELNPEEIRKDNIVLFDPKEGRNQPSAPGGVEAIIGDQVHFISGVVRKIIECAPAPLDNSWLVRYEINRNSIPKQIKYVHQLQNYFNIKPENNQRECICCERPWGWNDKDVFDFKIPVGKRVWPAICLGCRANLERRYKSKVINRSQLMMEFSNISGKIAKKCAVKNSVAVKKLQEFRPTRRGK